MLLAACGGDDGGGDDDDQPIDAAIEVAPDAAPVALDAAPLDAAPPDASQLARLEVTVEYAGTSTGALIVAGFTSFPPQGAPSAFAQDGTPTWPQLLALDNLEPGTIYAFAMLDAPPSSPTQPGPEDRTAFSQALALTAAETTTITLTLTDPDN